MKVNELTGAKLDYWVAKALGLNSPFIKNSHCHYQEEDGDGYKWEALWVPSRYWDEGGPIIQRESICLSGPGPAGAMPGKEWSAHIDTGSFAGARGYFGNTALEAAMRCYVASKFGEEVEDAE